MVQRPKTKEELQRREAIGLFHASRFVRKYARNPQPIAVDTVYEIHRQIFKDVFPEIAGKNRRDNISIHGSEHRPPHYSRVPSLMTEMNEELIGRLSALERIDGAFLMIIEPTTDVITAIDGIITVSAWLHHKIAYIHPFEEGNGRTARLSANLILERYGLVGLSVKIERESKNRYCNALAQIDKMRDYKPLKEIIMEGIIERYEGVSVKYY